MRIALVSHASRALPASGEGTVAAVGVHARSLVQLGHSVHVFAAAPPPMPIEGVLWTAFAREGVLVRAMVGTADFGLRRVAEALTQASDAFAGLRRQLRHNKFDVVELIGDGPTAGLLALVDQVPAVVRLDSIWPIEGPKAERVTAEHLARLGMRAARAVSVPSAWLRDELARRKVHGDAIVIADGMELPAHVPVADSAGEPRRLFVWFDGGDDAAVELAGVLADTLSQHQQLRIEVVGPGLRHSGLELLRARLGDTRLATIRPANAIDTLQEQAARTVGLLWFDSAPVCPLILQMALARGIPLLARAIDSIAEVVRHDIDGMLFEPGESAARGLDQLLKHAELRERLGQAARHRAVARFDPLACARRRLQVYALVAGERVAPDLPITHAQPPMLQLGPENWFEAWWLNNGERRPTRLARNAAGSPTLLELSPDELTVVEAVLVRAWSEGPRDWSAPEWADLHDFGALALDRMNAQRRPGDGARLAPAGRLVFPSIDHPMFAADQNTVLLSEAWRFEHHDRFHLWLSTAVEAPELAARAADNVNLRRVAVEAAMRVPSTAVFELLRRIYRDPRQHDQVVDADRRFLERGVGTEAFAKGIADLGLHAEMAKATFPTARRAPPPKKAASTARVSVLIPAYNHEAYVAEAIQSCLAQSIRDLRVIVADDRSPDRTVAVAEAIDDPRLRVQVNDANVGLGASVLAALTQVDTPYVALLNSDDLFHPERLKRCLDVLESDPAAALVATGFAVVDRDTRVLTGASSCAAEIGPKAHGWLRWFERIARDELHRPEDWISLQVLLRHNVLATSSNMVFRTAWLREHMSEASQLKYCFDWQLFLQAALEGSLRWVPDQLLAYRLHDTNTVWFRDGRRADYVLEVNRVVDRVLVQWLARGAKDDVPGTAAERLARLLEHDVRRHGETDGTVLYLASLARRDAADAADPAAPTVAALVDAALRRKAYSEIVERLDVDPWSLPWRAKIADRWPLEHAVAEGFVARARALEEKCARLRIDQENHRAEAEDLRARVQRQASSLEEERRDADQQRRRLREEAAAAMAKAEADFTAVRENLVASLQQATRSLADERSRATALTDELAKAASELAMRADRLAVLGGERDRLRAQLESTVAARDAALEDAHREARLRDRAVHYASAERAALVARLNSAPWRLGDVLMRRVGVLQSYKTLTAMLRRGQAVIRRVGWHLQRLSTAEGRARKGVVVFADNRDGPMFDERCLRWLATDGARPPRLVAMAAGLPAATLRSIERQVRSIEAAKCVWQPEDARLDAADRAYFRARNADAVDHLDQMYKATNWLGSTWRSARVAKTIGAGFTIAQGLRRGAAQAYATKLLCGSRYALALGDEDLVDLRCDASTARAVLNAAELLVCDSELVMRAAERLAGPEVPRGVVRFAVAPNEPLTARAPTTGVRAFVQWPSVQRADPDTLVAGIALAVAAGCDVTVDVVGGLGDGATGLDRWLSFQDRIETAGLAGRLRLHGNTTPAVRRQLLGEADCVLWIGRSIDGAGLPDVVLEAIAAGRTVIASAVREITWLPALAETMLLVAPGDAPALANAVTQFAGDRPGAARRLDAGRVAMAQRAADDAGRSILSVLRDSVRGA